MSDTGGDGKRPDGTVMAALIGGAAVVAAAFVQAGGGGRSAPATDPTPSATPTPTPTPSATPTPTATPSSPPPPDPVGPMHEVYLKNDCRLPIEVDLYYHERGGWTNGGSGVWKLQPSQGYYASVDGTRIVTDRNELYFRATSTDSSLTWDGKYIVTIGERRVGFRLAKVESSDNGDYQIGISCSSPVASTN